jgi:hypothetical protein
MTSLERSPSPSPSPFSHGEEPQDATEQQFKATPQQEHPPIIRPVPVTRESRRRVRAGEGVVQGREGDQAARKKRVDLFFTLYNSLQRLQPPTATSLVGLRSSHFLPALAARFSGRIASFDLLLLQSPSPTLLQSSSLSRTSRPSRPSTVLPSIAVLALGGSAEQLCRSRWEGAG